MNRPLSLLAVVFAVSFFAFTRTASAEPPFRFIYEAEWNNVPCTDYPITPEKWAAECIAPLVNTQVDCLLYNLCSSDGYCCQLDNGEILMDAFEKLPDAWVWRYRENTKRLIAANANPPKLACEYGHRLGMKVIPIVRMNDMHDMFFLYEVSRFKLENPHLLLGSTGPDWKPDWKRGYHGLDNKQGIDALTWGMFDFAHKEVRDHKLAIIEEFITRWDNDGVSLDFDRDPRFFKQEGKPENAALITDMIRRIRRTLDRVAAKRGRPQYLHVRVIPEIDVCYARGLDVRTWVKEGLVDVIAPGCGYMTFSLDLTEWLKLVEGRDCWIIPSNNKWKPTEETRAWAKLMYQRGAHGVQLFNFSHLLYGHAPGADRRAARPGTVWYHELHPKYYQVLHELRDLNTFSFKNCRYVWESYSHKPGNGEFGAANRRHRAIDDIALTVKLTAGRHTIPFGFAEDLPAARRLGLSPKVTLWTLISDVSNLAEYDLLVNGKPLPHEPDDIVAQRLVLRDGYTNPDGPWFVRLLPDDCLLEGENELTIIVKKLRSGAVPFLNNVEIDVRYVDLVEPPTQPVLVPSIPIHDAKLPVGLPVGKHELAFRLDQKQIDAAFQQTDRLLLKLRMKNYTYYDEFDVILNGHRLATRQRTTRAVRMTHNDSWVTYPVDESLLRAGDNKLVVEVRKLNPAITVAPKLVGVELLENESRRSAADRRAPGVN